MSSGKRFRTLVRLLHPDQAEPMRIWKDAVAEKQMRKLNRIYSESFPIRIADGAT